MMPTAITLKRVLLFELGLGARLVSGRDLGSAGQTSPSHW